MRVLQLLFHERQALAALRVLTLHLGQLCLAPNSAARGRWLSCCWLSCSYLQPVVCDLELMCKRIALLLHLVQPC